MSAERRRLYLVPWHIGDVGDLTLNAVRCARRLRVFLAEDPEASRRQFALVLGAAAAGKDFRRLPDEPDPAFLESVLALLEAEDVGLVADGGTPCFIDPGAWLVDALRARGVGVTALAGPSSLAALLSLSGVEWRVGPHQVFGFALFPEGPPEARESFLRAVARDDEPLVVFLEVRRLRECLEAMSPVALERRVSVFFDLTKGSGPRYPYADQVRTMTCAQWLEEAPRVRWDAVSDVSLLLHPRRL